MPPSAVLVCVECHITYGGVARVGMPCAFCDGVVIDLHAEVMRLAAGYDPIEEIIDAVRRESRPLTYTIDATMHPDGAVVINGT